MLLEQVYLFLIYILLSELAIVTVVAIALFVAQQKTHLCKPLEMCLL